MFVYILYQFNEKKRWELKSLKHAAAAHLADPRDFTPLLRDNGQHLFHMWHQIVAINATNATKLWLNSSFFCGRNKGEYINI